MTSDQAAVDAAPESVSGATDEYYIPLKDIEMGDVEVLRARPMHLRLAQAVIYLSNTPNTFKAVGLDREREYTERVAVFFVSQTSQTCILLIRSGDEEAGDGRTFYTAQLDDLLEDLPLLVEEHGFQFNAIRGDMFVDELPDEYTEQFQD